MSFVLHLALCLVVLWATPALIQTLSALAYEPSGGDQSRNATDEFWRRLVCETGAIPPVRSPNLDQPARLARRDQLARGREIEDKLSARIADEILPAGQDPRSHELSEFNCYQ